MGRKILLVLGNPNDGSLGRSIADTYLEEAQGQDCEIRSCFLYDLSFDLVLHKAYWEKQEWEPDLQRAADDVLWADHLVFVYPIWHGHVPAILKGFCDRLFLPNFAFTYGGGGLLKGKTAHLIVTSGGPKIYYTWLTMRGHLHTFRIN